MPLNPQDFCTRASFRLVPGSNQMEAKLDGVTYDVIPFGDDAVQVVDKETNEPVATLALNTRTGSFVLAGD